MIFNNQFKPEFISLHIPKTAGTSFIHTLFDVYGAEKVARFDIKPQINKLLLNGIEFTQPHTSTQFSIIHGHFTVQNLYTIFPEYREVPIITWVRNPVDRVISNYFYLVSQLQNALKEFETNRTILDKMMKSLEEFVLSDINRNLMWQFMDGLPLEAYAFIGIVEDYDAELAYLSKLMKWHHANKFNDNITEGIPNQIDSSLIKKIEALNEKDMIIYEKAWALKNQRMSL